MSFTNRVRQLITPKQNPHTLFEVDPEQAAAILEIANQQNESPVRTLNRLLAVALTQWETADHSLILWQQLTQREKEVTALVWLGLTNSQISEKMFISKYTVRAHMRNILAKYGVNSKVELREALQNVDLSDWMP